MNIASVLVKRAKAHPDAPAIVESRRGRQRVCTFSELSARSARAAGLMRAKGLTPGASVLVFQPISIELYVALLALFRAGLVAMFMDPLAGRSRFERCLDIERPAALIASARAHLLRLVSSGLRRVPVKFSIGMPLPGAIAWRSAERHDAEAPIVECDTDARALLTFTSGSTGEPKAAVRTHGFLLAQHAALERALALEAGQRDLSTLPIFVLANLASGVTSVIPDADLRSPGNIDAAPVLKQIDALRPTRSAASPAFYERLVDACEREGATLDSFTRIDTGGAPVFPGLLERLSERAPNAEVVAVYGSTEAEPIAHISRREISASDLVAMRAGKGLLAGRPVDEISLRIIDATWGEPMTPMKVDAFKRVCLDTAEPGEIVVHGAHVLPGYLDGRGDEETKFDVDGARWHRTGDAGYLDERGRLWLLGRASARIDDERGTLYPFAVECAALQCENVRRAALLRVSDKRVLAVEARKNGAVRIEAIKESLAWAKLDCVVSLPKIPVDARHNAKVDYPALEDRLKKSLALRDNAAP